MKNKFRCAALMMSGMLLIGGCGADSKEQVPQEEFGGPESTESSQGQIQTTIEEISETDASEEKPDNQIIEGRAPVITIVQDKKEWYTEDGKTLLLQAEASIVEAAGEGFDALQSALSERWSGLTDSYDDLIEMSQEDYNFREGEEQTYFGGYYSSEVVELSRSDSTVISFRILSSEYTGGAHGNYAYSGASFDVNSGMELQLEDLLSDAEGFYGEAVKYLTNKLEDEYGDGLFPEYGEYVAGTFDEDRTLSWYLNGAGIVIVYNPYEIGPYAMGTAEVTLPYTEFASYIREDYVKPHSSIIARIPVNEDISGLIGEQGRVILDYNKNEYELFEVTVLSADSSDEIGTFGSFREAYVIKRENGRSFMLVTCDEMSDDFMTFMYEVTDGRVQKCDELLGAQLSGTYIGTDRVGVSMHLDVLGTYQGDMEYLLDEEGRFIQAEDYFTIDREFALTIMKELPVLIEGNDTTLGIGTQIMITGTNNTDTAYFKVVGSDSTGEIKYVHDETQWQLLIDGVSEYEYFDMLPYAG